MIAYRQQVLTILPHAALLQLAVRLEAKVADKRSKLQLVTGLAELQHIPLAQILEALPVAALKMVCVKFKITPGRSKQTAIAAIVSHGPQPSPKKRSLATATPTPAATSKPSTASSPAKSKGQTKRPSAQQSKKEQSSSGINNRSRSQPSSKVALPKHPPPSTRKVASKDKSATAQVSKATKTDLKTTSQLVAKKSTTPLKRTPTAAQRPTQRANMAKEKAVPTLKAGARSSKASDLPIQSKVTGQQVLSKARKQAQTPQDAKKKQSTTTSETPAPIQDPHSLKIDQTLVSKSHQSKANLLIVRKGNDAASVKAPPTPSNGLDLEAFHRPSATPGKASLSSGPATSGVPPTAASPARKPTAREKVAAAWGNTSTTPLVTPLPRPAGLGPMHGGWQEDSQPCNHCQQQLRLRKCQIQSCDQMLLADATPRICAECQFERNIVSITEFNERLLEERACPHCGEHWRHGNQANISSSHA